MFLKLKIIEDINLWGPWQIIVENIPLFQDQLFKLLSSE